VSDSIADTISPKSDQLNADDLLAGPITVRVASVKRGSDDKQPVVITIEGDRKYQPFKPCLTIRRVLVMAWGEYPDKWIGRTMTLYRNPDVIYGGLRVGGIRISHLSDLDKPEVTYMLTATRGKKEQCTVKRLEVKQVHPIAKTELNALLMRIKNHIQDADERRGYVTELGVSGSPNDPASWSREAYEAAKKFCDEMEGGA